MPVAINPVVARKKVRNRSSLHDGHVTQMRATRYSGVRRGHLAWSAMRSGRLPRGRIEREGVAGPEAPG
jgi:hypothetical protein